MGLLLRFCVVGLLGLTQTYARPSILKVADAANYQPVAPCPGSIVSIFGSGLSSETLKAAHFPLLTLLGGTRVLIDGIPAPLFFVSPAQVNIQVPWSLFSKTFQKVPLLVESDGVSSSTVDVDLRYTCPRALQTELGGEQIAAAVHALSGELVTANNPARPGEVLSLYATGLGRPRYDLLDGLPQGDELNPVVDSAVKVGSVPGEMLYAGLAPGLVGVYQLNVRLSEYAQPGDSTPLRVSVLTSEQTNLAGLAVAPNPNAPGRGLVAAIAGSKLVTSTDVIEEFDGPAILAPLRSTRALAVAKSGDLYFAANRRMYRLSTDGMVSTLPKTEGNPRYIALDANGGIFVSEDLGGGSAQIIRLDGATLTRLVTDLKVPGGLAVDSRDRLYFADPTRNRIGRLNANGGVESVAVKDLNLDVPQSVAVDGTGTIYVGDRGDRIVKITPDGSATVLPGFRGTAQSLVFDSTGNLFVADTWKQWIWKISAGGKVEKIAGDVMGGARTEDTSPEMANFSGLSSLAIGPNNSLYAADLNSPISHIVLGNAPLTLLEICTSISTVTGNASLTGWAGLNRAVQKDVSVSLVSDDPSVSVPPEVVIPAGRAWTSFPISVTAPTNPTRAVIRALREGVFRSALLELKPEAAPVPPSPYWGQTMKIRTNFTSGQITMPLVIDLIPDNDRHGAFVQSEAFVFDFRPVSFLDNSFHATVLGTRNEVKGAPYSAVTAADLKLTIENGRASGSLAFTIRTLSPIGIASGYAYWQGPIEGTVQ
jgi:uncharacterized protein (TIGR03437 family)